MSDPLLTTTDAIESSHQGHIVRGLLIMTLAALAAWLAWRFLPYGDHANKGMALVIFVGILWLTEAVHITLTALMIPILAVAMQLPKVVGKGEAAQSLPITISQALASFADPIIFLFLGGFALAAALHVQKIDRKITLLIVRATGSNMFLAIAALVLVTAGLSMWISNTATAVMMMPLALGIMESLESKDRNTRVFILLVIAYAASIGGMGTLVGSPPNSIAAKEIGIGFQEWLSYGIPLMLVLLPLMFAGMYVLFRPKLGQLNAPLHEEDIPWTTPRLLTALVFLLTALAWIFSGHLKPFGITDTFIALMAIVAVVVLGLASWHQVAENTDWGVLLLFGGGIALSRLMQDSGASAAIGGQIAEWVGHASPLVVITVVAAFIIFLTEFTSNTASAALLVPVFATIGTQLGLPKQVLVLVIGLGASCAFMLPVATPPNAVVFGTGHVSQRDMMKAGLLLNFVSIAVVAAFAYWFWQ
ncbi:MAG: DASS family sodium-coupled anion symporter [Cardiobacteriaceae bacterium]|nr:DASS family sodium-coupled anion symporter [Cardiobacteriaceae bacterium]